MRKGISFLSNGRFDFGAGLEKRGKKKKEVPRDVPHREPGGLPVVKEVRL